MQKLNDGTLIIEEGWPVLRAACVIGGLLIPAAILWGEYQSGTFRATRMGGALLGAVLLLWVAAVISDLSFRFDAQRRALVWRRRNGFGTRGGEVPFSEIRDVLVTEERSRDDENTVGGYTVRYSALLVTSSGNLALTSTHSSNRADYDDIAATIRALVLGPVPAVAQDDAATRLVAAGRIIDAVSVLRVQQGLGLAEAHARIKEIQSALPKGKTSP